MSKSGSELGRMLCRNCRYVGVISPDITISNHRLRWAVHGMRFTAPLLWQNGLEVLHLFRCSTHTPRQAGLKTEVPTVRWRWGWQGDESEMRMKMGWKLLNRNTRRGTPKKRGGTKREHQHQHTLPGAGEPWKGKGKEKAEADGRTQRQAEGGRDGRAWTNLTPAKTIPT